MVKENPLLVSTSKLSPKAREDIRSALQVIDGQTALFRQLRKLGIKSLEQIQAALIVQRLGHNWGPHLHKKNSPIARDAATPDLINAISVLGSLSNHMTPSDVLEVNSSGKWNLFDLHRQKHAAEAVKSNAEILKLGRVYLITREHNSPLVRFSLGKPFGPKVSNYKYEITFRYFKKDKSFSGDGTSLSRHIVIPQSGKTEVHTDIYFHDTSYFEMTVTATELGLQNPRIASKTVTPFEMIKKKEKVKAAA